MPDDMIQIPIEQEELDAIYKVLSQVGEVVENEQTEQKETPFIICPNCGAKIPFIG
jgi:CRISPR/Cas system-associated exonuclease Cas4 (RecB family)